MGYGDRLVALITLGDQHTNVVADHFLTGAAPERHVSIGAWGVSCPLSVPQGLASRAARLPRWEGETATLHCVHQNTGSFHQFRDHSVMEQHGAYFPKGRPPLLAFPSFVLRKYDAAFFAICDMSHMLKDDVESYG